MRKIVSILMLLPILITIGCSMSYQFNGASIDYSKTKTIDIRDFVNQAPLVYPPLTQVFNEQLKDAFNRNTKLSFTDRNPHLEIEGEITRYDLTPLAIREDAMAGETRLTMSIRMRFKNNTDSKQDKELSFSAYQDFSSDLTLTDVQDRLIGELAKELVDQVFNATMSDW